MDVYRELLIRIVARPFGNESRPRMIIELTMTLMNDAEFSNARIQHCLNRIESSWCGIFNGMTSSVGKNVINSFIRGSAMKIVLQSGMK